MFGKFDMIPKQKNKWSIRGSLENSPDPLEKYWNPYCSVLGEVTNQPSSWNPVVANHQDEGREPRKFCSKTAAGCWGTVSGCCGECVSGSIPGIDRKFRILLAFEFWKCESEPTTGHARQRVARCFYQSELAPGILVGNWAVWNSSSFLQRVSNY